MSPVEPMDFAGCSWATRHGQILTGFKMEKNADGTQNRQGDCFAFQKVSCLSNLMAILIRAETSFIWSNLVLVIAFPLNLCANMC